MNDAIQFLPPEVVNLIAAGEVIDSFAAVVRELVENSLDAGATRITVSIFPQLWRVQVADNGKGISLTNLQKCAQAHSTSKIHYREDLVKIATLGFRGEALHSMAQLSQLEILSRTAGEAGWQVVYDTEGKAGSPEAVAIAPGTIVTVADLFGNLPVRRKGLPSFAVQLKAVQNAIWQIALCHPQVTWQVRQDDKVWFNISPGASAKDILPQVLRRVQVTDLVSHQLSVNTHQSSVTSYQLPVDNHESTIEFVLGLPDRCHRRRADWVRVAVNRRWVNITELEQAILAAFARTLPRDRYPVCFIHLRIDPSQIDWNRHPAKTEIYLHNIDSWREKISQGIEEALRISPANLPGTAYHERVGKLLKVSAKKSDYKLNQDLPEPEINKSASDITLMELRAVAQVHNTYIVAEYPDGLWLVEQHIAHERILYEKLLDAWQVVPLETPIILQYLQPKQLEQLEFLGIEIEPFGEKMWAARSAPEMLHNREDCAAALLELSQGEDLQTAQVATACRSAIRNGTPLSLSEMQRLLDDWKSTRNPRTCPHGRPIYLPLAETALARFFRRHWVIGKSHGI